MVKTAVRGQIAEVLPTVCPHSTTVRGFWQGFTGRKVKVPAIAYKANFRDLLCYFVSIKKWGGGFIRKYTISDKFMATVEKLQITVYHLLV